MTDRLGELMAKGQAAALTPVETAELARLLNAPVLEPAAGCPATFVSKHAFSQTDLATNIRVFNWFAHCGSAVEIDLTMPTCQVANWGEATKHCAAQAWEDIELEAQNQLSGWLHTHARERYQGWNEIAVANKTAVLNPLFEDVILPLQTRLGFGDPVAQSLKWDMLGALMENAYLETGHRSCFFLELLLVYEAGHFPCGWEGEWPQGRLLVY